MRDLIAELKSLNADSRALCDAAESLDCGAPDVWTMLMIELRAARSDTRAWRAPQTRPRAASACVASTCR